MLQDVCLCEFADIGDLLLWGALPVDSYISWTRCESSVVATSVTVASISQTDLVTWCCSGHRCAILVGWCALVCIASVGVRRFGSAHVEAFSGNVPDIVGRLVDPVSWIGFVSWPALAVLGVPWHALMD